MRRQDDAHQDRRKHPPAISLCFGLLPGWCCREAEIPSGGCPVPPLVQQRRGSCHPSWRLPSLAQPSSPEPFVRGGRVVFHAGGGSESAREGPHPYRLGTAP